jgi:hypothetical protein
MVCAVKAVPYEEIAPQFKKGERVSVVTCNTCARSQEAGGAKLMEEMSQRLVEDVGIEVVEEIVLTSACNRDYYDQAEPSPDVDKILCLGCWAGWTVIKRKFPDIPIVAGVETLGIPVLSEMMPVAKPEEVEP